VREWLFDGAVLPNVKLTILSPPLYPAKKPQKVTMVRTRDASVSQQTLTADAEGRLIFELTGEEYEVGVGAGAVAALRGVRLDGMEWATAGKPVKARVRFWNKGAAASKPAILKWISSNPGVQLETPSAAVPALEPGKYSDVPLVFTVNDPEREIVKMAAVGDGIRLPLEIPLFPDAPPAKDYRIADGTNQPVYREAVKVEQTALGNGNADGKAAPGERIAILLRDGEAWRGAELFTNNPCVDISTRLSDAWGRYDNVGASAKTSLYWVRQGPGCEPGRAVRMIARVVLPNKPLHRLRYAVIEFTLSGKP
jgi:hypothetical protein